MQWNVFICDSQYFLLLAASAVRGAMEKMQRAFDVYPYCATALNYLANHFFFTGQHFLVEQLTETALAATTHGSTRAHSYYNLARSYHSKVWTFFFFFIYSHRFVLHLWAILVIMWLICICNMVFFAWNAGWLWKGRTILYGISKGSQ